MVIFIVSLCSPLLCAILHETEFKKTILSSIQKTLNTWLKYWRKVSCVMTCHNKNQDAEANLKPQTNYCCCSLLLFSCTWLDFTLQHSNINIISGVHGFLSFTGTYSFILPSINLYQTIWLRLLCNCKKCCITKTSHVLPIFFLKEELTRMGEIENSLTIFVMATYGEGDPTDNAQEFYEWLQNDRDDLDCLNYTVSIYLYV